MAFKLDALTDKVPTVLKYAIAISLVWVVLGMTMCSCCRYTLGDIIRLAFHTVYNLLTGSDEVSIEITDIRKKTCECSSPWYSPCVIWGSKSAKESGCTKECKKKNDALNNGVDAAALGSQGAKDAFGCGCAATNTDVGAGGAAYVRDNVILPNRCGNRK
jgi:hypothetical protein